MVSLLLLSAFPAAMVISAFTDVADFKIPNWTSLLLVLAYPAAAVALGRPLPEIAEGLFVGCGCLVIGFVVFAKGWCGGGDAKLFAATAPWIGLSALMSFFLNMVIAGAFLAIGLMIFRKTPPLPVYAHAPWLLRMHQRPKDMPYAVAIAAGGLLTFPETQVFRAAFGG